MDQFHRWNKGTIRGKKVELRGLTRRRQAEAELFGDQLEVLYAKAVIPEKAIAPTPPKPKTKPRVLPQVGNRTEWTVGTAIVAKVAQNYTPQDIATIIDQAVPILFVLAGLFFAYRILRKWEKS